MKRALFILSLCVLMAGCFGKKPGTAEQPKAPSFPMVEVPGLITDQAEAAVYLTDHFWDKVETVSDLDSASFEQAVGSWATLVVSMPQKQGEKSVKALLGKLETLPSSEAAPLIEKVEKYLYDPNSPLRNEDLFCTLAKGLSASKAAPDSLRTHYAYLAEKCALNAVGTKAADFLFKQKDRVRSLYSVEADKLLLVFGNPECTACRELHAALNEMEGIPEMLAAGKLVVIEVNPDEDSIAKAETDKSYHIRAIPSMYLLDADKTVLLKDAPAERILAYLQNNK